jgi:hypothetical protein
MRGKAAVLASLLLIAGQLCAHHGPYGQFNLDQRVDFTGSVVAVEWTNPHAHVLVEATLGAGPMVYRIELRSLQELARRGWHGDELRPGTPVRIVEAALSLTEDRALICCARIYDTDGREYFSGSDQSSAKSGS